MPIEPPELSAEQLAEWRHLIDRIRQGDRSQEVLGYNTMVFAAGSQTGSVRMRTEELFGGEQATTVPLVKRPERASEDPIA